ncbi:MAG: hypothetical protein ABIK73_08620 [candidate division WOR-3 bacterium]
MPKKSENEYKRAFDRWAEEVDVSEFLDSDEAFESFSSWLNPGSGKTKGLYNFEIYFKQRFREQIETLPMESRIWFEWAERAEIPVQTKEVYRKAFERATGEAEWRKAWGKFYGSLPYKERGTAEAKSLWQELYKLFK